MMTHVRLIATKARLLALSVALALSTLNAGCDTAKGSSPSSEADPGGKPSGPSSTRGLAVTDTEVIVGQLHSATGTMAISETGSIQAERLAIEQINASGGILGRQIKVIQEDGASDWPTFAEKAKKLLVQDRTATVFGCWTSASRKAVLPVFEKENGLLYYLKDPLIRQRFFRGPFESMNGRSV